MSTIERTSPVPYYEQLYEILLDRVQRGEFSARDRLPSESELHRDFELSRATVRQALELLESNGWAVRVPRRGYFASTPPNNQGWLIEGQGGFLENDVGHRNDKVVTQVLRAVPSALPEHAAQALRLGAHASGFILERRRFLDGDLVLFSTNYSPPGVATVIAAAQSVLAGQGSLTQVLRDGGYLAEGAHRIIHALPAPRQIADHLEVVEGAALLRIRSVTWDSAQQPFDYYETWLRSDRVPLELSTSVQRTVVSANA